MPDEELLWKLEEMARGHEMRIRRLILELIRRYRVIKLGEKMLIDRIAAAEGWSIPQSPAATAPFTQGSLLEVSNPGRGANKSKGELTMCTNEETKKRVRQRLDSVLLAVKVAQTVEAHQDPEGGDAVVEVLMEELMKLHSCYGKERTCDKCDARERIATGPAEPRNDSDISQVCGDTCGCPDGEGWACQDEEPESCDRSRTYDLSFGIALEAAKHGARIARKGWNGKKQYVFLARDLEFHTEADLSEFEEHGVFVHDALAIKTSVDQIQIGWLASQSDMLSNDWYVVE